MRPQKTRRNGADVTWHGSSFQTRAAATWTALSPTVENRVRWTTGDDVDDAEWRRFVCSLRSQDVMQKFLDKPLVFTSADTLNYVCTFVSICFHTLLSYRFISVTIAVFLCFTCVCRLLLFAYLTVCLSVALLFCAICRHMSTFCCEWISTINYEFWPTVNKFLSVPASVSAVTVTVVIAMVVVVTCRHQRMPSWRRQIVSNQ